MASGKQPLVRPRGSAWKILLLVAVIAVGLWVYVFARTLSGRQAQRHIDAGIEYIRAAQPGKAEQELQAAARLSPDNADLWELLGELYLKTERWSKGRAAFENLLRVAPRRPYVYSRLAACALRGGDELEAQRCAHEELKRNPNDSASLTMLAFLSDMQNDLPQRISYLQRLLALHPTDASTMHDLIEAYTKSEKYADMLPMADRLLAIKPGDGFALALRGAARYETDASPVATAQAEADLSHSLQQQPQFAFALYSLGRVYARQGQFRKAISELEQAQGINPGRMDIPFALTAAYARAGQTAKAQEARARFEYLRQLATHVSVLQKQCSLEKDNFAAHLEMGQLTLTQGDYRQATYYLQRALALKPDDPGAKQAYQELAAQINQSSGLSASPQTPPAANAAP